MTRGWLLPFCFLGCSVDSGASGIGGDDEPGCVVGDRHYELGETFSDDGCNACVCEDVGALCTFRYCGDGTVDEINVVIGGRLLPRETNPLPGYDRLSELPDPPEHGVRLALEPTLALPEVDSEGIAADYVPICQSWPVPDLHHRWVYRVERHATPELMNAVLYALPVVDPPEAYPRCRSTGLTRAQEAAFRFADGASDESTALPTVLYANERPFGSTSVFEPPNGWAQELGSGFEIVADIDVVNRSTDTTNLEAVWDLHTMPVELVVHPATTFVHFSLGALLPHASDHVVAGTCDWPGGDVVAVVAPSGPLTTRRSLGFVAVDPMQRAISDSEPGLMPVAMSDGSGTLLARSFEPALDTEGTTSVHHRCDFAGHDTFDACVGVGHEEHCAAFLIADSGDLHDRVGISAGASGPCFSVAPGGDERVSEWLLRVSEEAAVAVDLARCPPP